jgi:hypothetical protein
VDRRTRLLQGIVSIGIRRIFLLFSYPLSVINGNFRRDGSRQEAFGSERGTIAFEKRFYNTASKRNHNRVPELPLTVINGNYFSDGLRRNPHGMPA